MLHFFILPPIFGRYFRGHQGPQDYRSFPIYTIYLPLHVLLFDLRLTTIVLFRVFLLIVLLKKFSGGKTTTTKHTVFSPPESSPFQASRKPPSTSHFPS